MRILWVSPFLPHPDAPHAGGRVVYQWLSKLGATHDITLLCRLRESERLNVEKIRTSCKRIQFLEFNQDRKGRFRFVRSALSYVRIGLMANKLSRSGDFDILHVEFVETGLGIARRLPIPRVLIAHDELSKPARRRYALAQNLYARIGHYIYWFTIGMVERSICRRFDRILALSEQDRQLLLELDPSLQVRVLPVPVSIALVNGVKKKNSLVFVGAMHRDVNVDAMIYFCREILPLIREKISNASLTIVGNEPPEEIRDLSQTLGVEVTGFVPALEPYYAAATVFVAPLRIGGGIIVKILDAMAAGCPVVTTSVGNEGIGAIPGEHLLTADQPQAFAEAVLTLLRDESCRTRLADRGRMFVETRFNIDASIKQLERVYGEIHYR